MPQLIDPVVFTPQQTGLGLLLSRSLLAFFCTANPLNSKHIVTLCDCAADSDRQRWDLGLHLQ